MSTKEADRPVATRLPALATTPIAIVAGIQVVVLTALSWRYGFHRDELYFIAAGNHPAFGYVDQPPITPLLAKLSITLFGDTPMGLRVVATLLGVLTVFAVALVARELGGGRRAQLLAAAGTALSSFVLVSTHMLSTPTVDELIWVLVGWCALRLLRTGDQRWWLAVGLATGIGLENKWLLLGFLAAFGLCLAVLGPRSVFRSWWLALGVLIAVVVAAPDVIWQAAHGFPLLSVAGGISQDDGGQNRILFVPMQLVYLSPVLVPVWVAGFVRLWRDPALRFARALAPTYPLLCIALLIVGGKPYYPLPLLLLLMAAGAEPSVRWLVAGNARLRQRVLAVLALIGAVISILVSLPVLPPPALNGLVLALNAEQGEQVAWPNLVATVADAWQQIPPAQRANAVVFTANYGEAGAIAQYAHEYGLPTPYSGHMSYSTWGPPPDTMTGPVLLVGKQVDFGPVQGDFHDCRLITVYHNNFGLHNKEWGADIQLCQGTTAPWSREWSGLIHYYNG